LVEVELDSDFGSSFIDETSEGFEYVSYKASVYFGSFGGREHWLKPGLYPARYWRFGEKQDDGGHMSIVKLDVMKKTVVLSLGTASLVALSLISVPGSAAQAGKADKGKEVFEQCSVCHNADSDEKKMGPGLKGLFKKEKMQNGKKPTEENVRGLINQGGNGMPAYEELLSKEERDDLMAYLKTL
jgi:cytochrome c